MLFKFKKMTMKFYFLLFMSKILFFIPSVNAELITYSFEGFFNSGQSNDLFNAGDRISGSYTFESNSSLMTYNGPDPAIDNVGRIIDDTLIGTKWDFTIFSSLIGTFSHSSFSSSTFGNLTIGNNSTFGDLYIVTLGDVAYTPPNAGGFNFLQLDLRDSNANGADIIDGNQVSNLPDFSLASFTGGRFFVLSPTGGCTQCGITLTSLYSSVPEPSFIYIFITFILSLSFYSVFLKKPVIGNTI